MKKIIAIIIYACIFSFSGYGQWKQDKFILGTFYDPQVKDCKLDTAAYISLLKGVKNCNLELLTGVDGCYDFKFVAYKFKLLSQLGLKGLQINLSSSKKNGVDFNAAQAADWLKFVSGFDAQQRSAFYGYFVYDEPLPKDAAAIRKWMAFVKTKDPGKLAYLNLLPVYVFKTRQEYENYLDSYISPVNSPETPDMISYDFYPFIQGGIKDNYFYNLYILRKKAAGRPLWGCVLTTKHREYTDVGPYQINFMVFAPVTYGFKGLLYFTYQTIVGSSMPFGAAMIADNKQPTNKYFQIQKINAFMRDVWGPIVMNSTSTGVYQISGQPYNQQPEDGETITAGTPLLAAVKNNNMTIGVFKSLVKNGEYNLMLFNKSAQTLKQVPIVLKNNLVSRVSLAVPYTNYRKGVKVFSPLKASYNSSSNTTTVYVDFQGGEGRVLKVSGVSY
ncbi:hypothetical protein [Chitinophaga qingshengii]|uniref:Glycoside hydrolase family 42 N-terminal domain-containing protein n=1 Tax=Chitinophaga qingshengii TaxID=1569794 RepID=A0ABR7TTK8_9BACT|nr:hypothetical protein [Chitinophaga qingshengii]MBC9933814.1 hypothetical protein [Chitinophaga qingshengii]